MDEISGKPKITLEISSDNPEVLIVGEKSQLSSTLREILNSKGIDSLSSSFPSEIDSLSSSFSSEIKINDPSGFDYVFQLGNFEKIEFFLGKAVASQAKFFLIINEDIETKLSEKAEKATLRFIQTQKLDAKIIKISGFNGEEIEAVKKILKVAFSQTPQKIISLAGPETFWGKGKKQRDSSPQKRFLLWVGSIVSLIILLTLPITFILANIFLGTLALKNTKDAIFASNFEKGKKQAVSAQRHFTTAKNSFEEIVPLFRFLGKETQAEEIETELKIGQDLGLVARRLIEVGQEGQKLIRLILGQEQGRIGEILPKFTANVSLAEEELSLIKARASVRQSFLSKIFEQIGDSRKSLVEIKSFLKIAPWALGVEGKRTYLVLFQNNFELRPGGGFIGSIGLLTFTDGKLDFKIEDVYTVDGQLRGHVEPPEPIKKYLEQIHWYLRDSNWDPDFPTSAQRTAWFLEKELGIRPDGVIALDLALVKNILAFVGSVHLADYQEEITADNLFLKAQTYSQEGFFPGSTQKRDFLGTVTRALFDKLAAENRQPVVPWLGLGKAIEEAIEGKHLAIFFENEPAQRLVSEMGWGGEVKNVKCQMPNVKCLEDYLMIVEANLGVNKSNYFVKREVKKEIKFEKDSLSSKITLVYENTSPANVSFGGVYKNYLRVLTPVEFSLGKITIDNQELNQKEVDLTTILGKKATGFLVEIPPGVKKKVEVSFKMPVDLAESAGEFTYQLLVQKQPGTEKDPLTFSVFTPSWQISETNFPSLVKIGNLSYNTDLSVDRLFKIKFKKE